MEKDTKAQDIIEPLIVKDNPPEEADHNPDENKSSSSEDKSHESHKGDAWKDKQVLNRMQINQAIMDIDDVHPLRDSSKFDNIYPLLKYFRKYSCCEAKPTFKFGLRKTLLKEMSIKMPKKEVEIQ